MGRVHLEHVEAGAFAAHDARYELVSHAVHIGARHLARHLAMRELALRVIGKGRGRDDRPPAFLKGLVHPFPHELGRAFAAGMAELQADARLGILMGEGDDAGEGGFLRVVP